MARIFHRNLPEMPTVSPGSDAGEIEFSSFEEFEFILKRESEEWSWLLNYSGKSIAAAAVKERVTRTFNDLRRRAANTRSQQQHLNSLSGPLNNAFMAPEETLVYHGSDLAREILEAKEALSDEEAIVIYGFLRGILSLGDVKSVGDLRAILWAAAPGLDEPDRLARLLKAERANTRNTIRGLIEETEQAALKRSSEWDDLLKRARFQSLKWARKRIGRWRKSADLWQKRNADAESSIRAVELSYRESMALKAPVEYWSGKAKQHKSAEVAARNRLVFYFPVAILLIGSAFTAASFHILATPVASISPGFYVVASAGLASVAGLLFWIGRLLTKLYLSEHHLRHDAEERAVMTTTYLALTAEKAAADADRQLILSALFRGTSDGIVKEDGGLDPSLASILSKALVR